MKNKHRIKQGLSLLLAGGIALTNLGAALPAFAEDAPATPETAEATTPETAEANVPTPNLSQITENLYADLRTRLPAVTLAAWVCPWQPARQKSVSPRGFLTCMTA